MEILHGLEEFRKQHPNPVVTIGNFDGVHLGHQALFAKCRERAQATGSVTMAVTFEPHPMRVLRPAVNLPLITPLEQKLKLIEENGIDVTLCVRFDEHLAAITADNFVDKLLTGRLQASEIVVGHDFAFGHKGLGDTDLLRSKGRTNGFLVHQVGPVMVNGRPVSSTRVRQVVGQGDLETARRLLGRHYRIAGQVVGGHGRGGRVLGFPTANLKISDELLPGGGVYAVLVQLENGHLEAGVTNIGSNPTFDQGGLNVESHLLDFKGDIYDQEIMVHFVQRLRAEKRFESPQALAEQIAKDIELARQLLPPWQNGSKAPDKD